MASTRDVQDMLGIQAHQTPRPKPSKKGKNYKKKGTEGSQWNKEIRSLMGERAPPIPISTAPKWKDKRSRMIGPVRKWRVTPFKNDARTDTLVLRHWKRVAEEDVALISGIHDRDETLEQKQLETQSPYSFSKYNKKVSVPTFTHEEYEEHLQNSTWSEYETRYLLALYEDFGAKWPLIVDRYDYSPPATQDSSQDAQQEHAPTTEQKQVSASQRPPRRMEDLKQRYYEVAGKIMGLRIPPTQMNEQEYRDHELMLKFHPHHEITRKKIKEQQMSRTLEEQKEERYLLAELKRIYQNQERFDADLRELRSRVDHSLTDDKLGPQPYTSSAQLTELFQRFAMQDKNKLAQQRMAQPRRSLPGEGMPTASAGSPTASTPLQSGHKKGASSVTDASSSARNLTPRAEARFGVSTHDRLTSGISFVSDRIAKARAATKSQTQNTKIAAILAEAGIPDILQMQTEPVCQEMEKLVEMAAALFRTRTAMERTMNEISITRKQLEMEGLLKREEGQQQEGDVDAEGEKESMNEDGEQVVPDAQENDEASQSQGMGREAQANGEQPDIKAEEQQVSTETYDQTRGGDRKRSASVLSAASASSRGPKRKSARK